MDISALNLTFECIWYSESYKNNNINVKPPITITKGYNFKLKKKVQ